MKAQAERGAETASERVRVVLRDVGAQVERERRAVVDILGVFCKYLQYVRQCNEQRFHPLSVLIRKALRARDGTIEEAALALSVAIDGVLHLGFEDMGRAGAGVVDAVRRLEAPLEDHLKSSVRKDRIEGFFRAVTRPPRTALQTLVTRGVVTEEHVKAWEGLRHAAAHGKEYELQCRRPACML